MTLDIQDAIYGLRNLSVGDEEETRVEDLIPLIEDETLRKAVGTILTLPPSERDPLVNRYAQAYKLLIAHILRPFSRDEVLREARRWVAGWNAENVNEYEVDGADIHVEELMSVYDEIFGTLPRPRTLALDKIHAEMMAILTDRDKHPVIREVARIRLVELCDQLGLVIYHTEIGNWTDEGAPSEHEHVEGEP